MLIREEEDNKTAIYATFPVLQISQEFIQIFTWVVYSIVCQLIDVFGIITNIINIICFVKQGFQNSINVSLLGLSLSDLGCLITLTWTNMFVTFGLGTADLPFDPMEVYYLISAVPHLTFARLTSWITALITLERCLCVVAPLQVKKMVTPKRTFMVITCIFVLFFASVTPTYVVNRLGMKFSQSRNKSIVGLISMDSRAQVEAVSFMINNFSLPLTAFMIILICTLILSFKLEKTRKWRENNTASQQAEKVSTRHQKLVKMVVTISTLFIICFFPICVGMLASAIEPELYVSGKFINIAIIVGGVCFILESVNSSVNIFIYYNMSSKYRATFWRVFCGQKIW